MALMDAQMSERLANCGSSFQKMSTTRAIEKSAESTRRSLVRRLAFWVCSVVGGWARSPSGPLFRSCETCALELGAPGEAGGSGRCGVVIGAVLQELRVW